MLLKAETRKKILVFPFARELTNLYVNKKNNSFYKKINNKKHFDKKILKLRENEINKRCFIVGSGPSLTKEQLDKIIGEVSFGSNRIYKMFEVSNWRPKYYVIQDAYDSTPKNIYEKLDVKNLFVSDYYWRENGMLNKNAICYKTRRNLRQKDEIRFSKKILDGVYTASTVTYTMIQIAVFLGFEEIYLIGMDHTYANETDDKGKIVVKNNVKSHAFKDENPNEVVANISYMEKAYKVAKKFCDDNNIKIYNATIGGKLEIFERVNFWSLFNEGGKK